MSKASEDQKLFKLMLGAIASETLTPEDYRAALSNLRDGQMVRILEQVLGALSGNDQKASEPRPPRSGAKSSRASERNGNPKSPDQLFDDIKRRKITRDRLEIIIRNLDSNFDGYHQADTMRNLLRDFRDQASERQWQLLESIVNGDYEADPYLGTISNNR